MKFNKFTSLAIVATAASTISANAQQSVGSISGVVKDNLNEEVYNAAVQIKDGQGKYINGATTDFDGSFIVNDLPYGTYTVTVTYLGMSEYTKSVTVNSKTTSLGIVKLSPATTTLKEVEIVGTALAAKQVDDTTQFNASSYKVNPDATTEDLLRKVPGVDLSDGTVKAQGESVSKVLVDGKAFFGDDAINTLRSLPAEVVDKIQIYDERSEQSRMTGFDDGERSKYINIVTRPDKRNGAFGKVFAGGGVDKLDEFRYNTGGQVNFFNGSRRFTVVAQTNNINTQNFSTQDLMGNGGRGPSGGDMMGGGGGRGGNSGGGGNRGGNTGSGSGGSRGGINTTKTVGLNYSDMLLNNKMEVSASYFYNHSDNVQNSVTEREYLSRNTAGQTYNQVSDANTKNGNHRLNARVKYDIDSFNSILWDPSLSIQNRNSSSILDGYTLGANGNQLNSTKTNYGSEMDALNFNNMLMYNHRFKKAGRSINLFTRTTVTNNNGTSNQYSENLYFESILDNDTLNQFSDIKSNSAGFEGRLSYTEPISKSSGIEVSYKYGYTKSKSDKITNNYDYLTGRYDNLDSLLSNKYETEYTNNGIGLRYRYNKNSFTFNAGVDGQRSELTSNRTLPNPNYLERKYDNLLPTAFMRYNITKTKNVMAAYRTSTSSPSVEQLQDVIDNSNPLQLTSGNSRLDQSYSHTLFARYSATSSKNNSSFFAMLRGTATQDYVGQKSILAYNDTLINGVSLANGGTYTTRENMDGFYNLNGFVTYGKPISAIKSNINVNLGAGYGRTPSIVNGAKNFSNTTNVSLGVVFSSNISENIDYTLTSNSAKYFVKNTLNSSADNEYFNQNTRLSINYIFWKGLVFNTELNHQYYKGKTSLYDQNFFLWNMSFGKKFLKNQNGEIKLVAYDLLGQNISYVPTQNELYNQSVTSNVLQRYFMLTFTYNIRNFKKGGSDLSETKMEPERKGPPGGGPGFHPPF